MKKILYYPNEYLSKGISFFFSISIYLKVFGIGAFMVLAAGFSFLYVESNLRRNVINIFAKKAIFMASTISSSLENHLAGGDRKFIHKALGRVVKENSDLRYIALQNKRGIEVVKILTPGVSSKYKNLDLWNLFPSFKVENYLNFSDSQEMKELKESSPDEMISVDIEAAESKFPHGVNLEKYFFLSAGKEAFYYQIFGESIFKAIVPMEQGKAGRFMIGFSSIPIHEKLIFMKKTIIYTMIICLIIGFAISLALTYLLSKPIKDIIGAAEKIRKGDFKSRAKIFYNDEVGSLGLAFNQMAESLEKFKKKVDIKENQCGSLINKLIRAQEEERKSISRELHDHLSQSLSALLLQINTLAGKKNIETSDNDSTQHLELKNQTKNIIDDVRRLAWSMRPSILDDYGLDSALARYVDEMIEQYRIPIDYHYESSSSSRRLPASIEVSLYRITQEALNNALRHSMASQISIVLIQKEGNITLILEDNGIGIAKNNDSMNSKNSGLGLIGMRERATLIGGGFTIESLPKQGTTIQVRIPILLRN